VVRILIALQSNPEFKNITQKDHILVSLGYFAQHPEKWIDIVVGFAHMGISYHDQLRLLVGRLSFS
jgi:hypothetical protein